MYTFLSFAHTSGRETKEKLIAASNNLLLWTQNNISQEDGPYINDTDSDWKGTTVFNAMQLPVRQTGFRFI